VLDLFFSFNQYFAGRNIREEIDRKELDTVLKSLVSLQFFGQTKGLRSQLGEASYGSERISLLI